MNKLSLPAWLLYVLLPATGMAEPPRDASVILKDYAAVQEPVRDPAKANDPAYRRSYLSEHSRAMEKRAALARELYAAHPNHPDALPTMFKVWSASVGGTSAERSIAEMEQFLKEHPDSKDKGEVLYQRAKTTWKRWPIDAQKNLAAAEDFIRNNPPDERGAELLSSVTMMTRDSAERLNLYCRIVADYPSSRAAGWARGGIRKVKELGQPFELAFKDAVSGRSVSVQGLRGKVVVVDFWATWCGPCIAELPTMKDLYAQYKDQGVEFVGVSLDVAEGGLEKLKAFVEAEAIPWPQYYQGNGWDSEFSASWGINSIPRVFILDAEGKLHSAEAHGQLATLIPELLKKRAAKTE